MSIFRFEQRGAARTWRGAPGKRCYAIGDVHGRRDLLEVLFDKIASDMAGRESRETVLVLLGDVIDKGPDSRGVVDLLLKPLPFPARLICLKGNHEDTLVRGLRGETYLLTQWLKQGGLACARSYGVDASLVDTQLLEVIEHNLAAAIPRAHLRFLESLADTVRFGDYLLVHAGLRPGVPLKDQTVEDLRWIRKPFLDSKADHGLMVVHGHSVTLEVEQRPNRIGIDTGAYTSGVLTALCLEDDQRWFLTATDADLKGRPEPTQPLFPQR